MPKKLPDLSGSAELGDIDDIMHNQSVSDLSWLDVDVDEYRKFEALPQQNLDIIPELSKALMEDDRDPRVPARIPMRHNTIVNSNPLDRPQPPVRSSVSSVSNRVASYVMAGLPDSVIRGRLLAEFSPDQLRQSSSSSLEILGERGLLGNVYVDASHFPRCAQQGEHRKFVAKHCNRSLYVLKKDECTGCVCNKSGRCSSFQKKIVDSIPYDSKTLAHYLPQLVNEKRIVASKIPNKPEERRTLLQAGFLKSPIVRKESNPQTIRHQKVANKPAFTEQQIQEFWARKSASEGAEPMPSAIYMMAARRIMLGTADARSLVASSDPTVSCLAYEHGILGYSYVDGDALGGPREAFDFINKHNSSPDFVLLRKEYNDPRSIDALSRLSTITRIVSRRPGINRSTFISACERAVNDGRMESDQARSAIENAPSNSDWAKLTSQANLYKPPAVEVATVASPAIKGEFFHGDTGRRYTSSPMSQEEVRKTISHMMNSGLYGKALKNAILSRYSRNDLSQVPEVGRSLAADDGVQGFYFLDPTAYRDYGKGCSDGAKHFRKQGAQHVLACHACTGCNLQTAPGWCSKYSKRLIRQVPQNIRNAAAERRRLPLVPSNNAPISNPVEEWGLTAGLTIDTDGAKTNSIDIDIPSPEI